MGLVIVIIITLLFYFKAKKNNLKKNLWAFIGFMSFFIGIVISALIMVIIDPDIPTKVITERTILIGTGAGIFNSIISWLLMSSKIKENQ